MPRCRCVLTPLAAMLPRGGCTDDLEVRVSDWEQDMDTGQLKLRRDVLWTAERDEPYSWRMDWFVEGLAGAVSFGVRIGQFGTSPGKDFDSAPGVRGLFQPLEVVVHTYRPWPGGWEDPESDSCRFLHGGHCHERVVAAPLDDTTLVHELLVRLVQPGGEEYVYGRLEQTYREMLDMALSEGEKIKRTAQEAAALAEARAQGAARAGGFDAERDALTSGD